ncbi:MAG: ABC transporter ATP-binding protein [Candidatus Eisenbacteria bacterium]
MDESGHVRFKDVWYRYPKGEKVLEGVDVTLRTGERLGLIGHIGCGKTTLLHLIVGLICPDRGSIEVFGRPRSEEKDFWEVRERVGLVFQDPDDQLFCPTVREDIAFGPLNLGRTREETDGLIQEALADVGLKGFEDRITHHLSGGEKRLVSLATVLAMKPAVLLLDEPANDLDTESAERIRNLLLRLPQSMIVVSHDRGLLEAVTTRIVKLENGRIKEVK